MVRDDLSRRPAHGERCDPPPGRRRSLSRTTRRMTESFAELTAKFDVEGEFVAMEPIPGGYINDSYRVTLATASGRRSWLLQRVNPTVFTDPDRLMENIAHVTRHVANRLRKSGVPDWSRRTLVVVPLRGGGSH